MFPDSSREFLAGGSRTSEHLLGFGEERAAVCLAAACSATHLVFISPLRVWLLTTGRAAPCTRQMVRAKGARLFPERIRRSEGKVVFDLQTI